MSQRQVRGAPASPGSVPRLLRGLALAWVGLAGACAGLDNVATVALQGRVLTDTSVLGVPVGLLTFEDRFVVQDAHAFPAVHLFDRTGRRVGHAGRHGSGPGEFVSPMDVFGRAGHPTEFWVYDSRLGRLTAYDLGSPAADGVKPLRDPTSLSEPVMVEAPRWLDDSTLIALNGMLQEGRNRFSLYGADGVLRGTMGEPPPGDPSVRPFVRQQAYGGKIAVHPSRPLFVLASRYAGRVEVFDRSGARVRSMEVPDEFEPDFKPAHDGLNMVRGPRFRFGYIDVAASEERIYGLFSGRMGTNADPNHGEEVHVFDWEGRLLEVLRLDQLAFRITVSQDGKALYAVGHTPQPQVVAYDLPSTLS